MCAMPPRALWLALPLVAVACAAPERRHPHAEAPTAAGVARGRFEPPESDAVFGRAVRAACGASTCLSRQSFSVVVGHRGVRVTVAREVFDGALRTWTSADATAVDREA